MAKELSLLDEFKSRSYDASLIATYNAFLPFYEDVLLRRLAAKGCLHNVVMMDSRQCGAILEDDGARPKTAGRDYSLMPIPAAGAFHPKIILLVARNHGVLFVGSHNLTMSGFGLNGELTTRFEYSADRDRSKDWATLATFQSAFRFLKDWAGSQPDEIREMLDRFEQLAPWLRDLLPADAESSFIGSRRIGPPLWDLVRAKLPDRARQITVVGPFFDPNLEFLQKLDKEFAPKKLVIGLDPHRTEIPRDARQLLPRAKFVSVESLNRGKNYVHAKAILIESAGDKEILLTGSANPSRAAWLASARRNAEAVVIQSGQRGRTPAASLGLTKLAARAELSAADWERLSEIPPEKESENDGKHLPVLAFITGDGFEIVGVKTSGKSVDEIKILTGAGQSLGICRNLEIAGDRIRAEIGDIEKIRVAMLELRSGQKVIALAIVHHLEKLQHLGSSDAQRAFRRSLASLSTDNPMLEDVLRIVNKVIFEDFDENTTRSSKERSDKDAISSDDSVEISEFEVSIAETKKAKRRKRFYAEGDLGLILNALIYNLGAGLRAEAQSSDHIRRSEEEIVDSEDEELVPEIKVDGHALAEVCRRKVKTLLKRMLRQFESASKEGANHLRPILQLAAVLGVINYLRDKAETASWAPRKESLLPVESLRDFFIDSCWYLYARQSCLLKEAILKLGCNDCKEISVVRGLLIWLAWECGLDVETELSSDDDDEEIYSRLLGLEQLLHLAPDLFGDDAAAEIARQAITRADLQEKYNVWLARHQRWSDKVVEMNQYPEKAVVLRREPERGDVVRNTRGTNCPFTVVLERNGNKVNLGEKIDSWYVVDAIEVIDFPMLTRNDQKSKEWSSDVWRRLFGY